MSDEIYDHMVYDGETHVCLLTYPSIRDRLILLNGWSKTYAMTGWRLGYAVWPGKLYDYARKLAVNLHSCVNASAQFAGLAALKGPQDEVWKMVAEFDKRRKVVVEGLNKLPGVSCATPKGAFYAFPNIKRTGWKAKALASSLLEDAGVAIIGGPDFGILGEGYVRLSYANSTENILKALGRMGEFLGKPQGGVSHRSSPRRLCLFLIACLDRGMRDAHVAHRIGDLDPFALEGIPQRQQHLAAHIGDAVRPDRGSRSAG